MSQRVYCFADFVLDEADATLSRGPLVVELTPKAFDVLRTLVANAGRLMTKDQLLAELWPGTYVTESALTVCVAEARRALGDSARAPRYIETAHRRGYRFIAPVEEQGGASPVAAAGDAVPAPRRAPDPRSLVGRDREMAVLEAWLARAAASQRCVGFVAGEAGIGKTSLLEAFLARVEERATARVARGQCLQAVGVAEPYMPVLEALGRLCREPERERMVELLGRYAPTWLGQMPWLVPESAREALARSILGATQQRMLREMAEAVEALTADSPLVLALEDLQWSDPATLDLVALLAQRREPARLLLLATYRPLDAILAAHPLRAVKQALRVRAQCEELALDFLPASTVPQLLAARLGASSLAPEVVSLVHRRTDGNPLFMLDLAEHLLAHGALARRGGAIELVRAPSEVEPLVPENLRQMVEREVEELAEDEQRVLEAASVVGPEWEAETVAALLAWPLARAEDACERLAEGGGLIRSAGLATAAGGRPTGRFAFVHALYRDVLYDRSPSLRRARSHRQLGERLEAQAAQGSPVRAAELALHFAQGRDPARAIHHLRAAAQEALRRRAPREAIAALDRALELAAQLPAEERVGPELDVLEQRGRAAQSMGELAAAAADFDRVADAAARSSDVEREVRVSIAAANSLFLIDRRGAAARLARAVTSGECAPDAIAAAQARGHAAYAALRAEGFSDQGYAASALAVERSRAGGSRAMLGQQLGRHAYFLALCSRHDEAIAVAAEAAGIALAEGDLFEYLLAEQVRFLALLDAGRYGEAVRAAAAGEALAERNGHPLWALIFRLFGAWLGLCAGDAEGAARRLDGIAGAAEAAGHRYTADLGAILLGAAETARGDLVAARLYLDRVAERRATGRPPMEWSFGLWLHLARAELELADGEPAAAFEEVERARALAARPGERSTLLRAHRIAALAAAREGDVGRAAAEIGAGLALLGEPVPPLAAAELLAAAAELPGRPRRGATRLRAEGRAYLERILAHTVSTASTEAGGRLHGEPAGGSGPDAEVEALAAALRGGSLGARLGAV